MPWDLNELKFAKLGEKENIIKQSDLSGLLKEMTKGNKDE